MPTSNIVDGLDDVILSEVTDICDAPLDNIYADMLRRSGLRCDSREEMIGFLGAMMEAHDKVKSRLAGDDNGVMPLRRCVLEQLRDGESIIDVAEDLNMSLDQIVRTLTNNRASLLEAWGERRWADVEDALYEYGAHRGELSQQWLAGQIGESKSTASTLIGWYFG